ncbi:MAG: ABC transporter permease [Actinomycetaceae bacterium]|nr:ABC transporter permease [Actinomycetaceae bacterium]
MIKLTWRDILAHPKRFLFTIVAVVLGVAFLTGTLALRDQLQDSFDTAATSGVVGDLHVQGQPLSEFSRATAPVPNGLAERVEEVPGVEKAQASHAAPTTILGADDRPVISAALMNVVTDTAATFTPWEVEGNAPRGANEVAIEERAMERLGVSRGERIKFVVYGETVDATIVGTLKYPKTVGGVNILAMDRQALTPMLTNPQTADEVVVQVAADADPKAVAADIEVSVGGGYVVKTSQEVSDSVRSDLNTALGFITAFILVFNALALGVSVFIIANTFTMVVRARQKEFAYLRAIGVSPLQVFVSIAVQAAIIGLLGSALGVAAGSGLVALATWGLSKLSLVSSVSASVSASIVVTALVVGVAVTIFGALWPGRRAAQIPPVEAMREVSGVKEKPVWPRLLVGVLLLVIATALLVWGARSSGLMLGIGAGLAVLGVLVAAPGLVLAVLTVVGRPLTRTRALWLRLGAGNSLRNPRRTAATGGALVIGIGLVSAALVLADSLQVSIEDQVTNELKADLMVAPLAIGETIPDKIYQDLADAPGVGTISSLNLTPAPAQVPGQEQPVSMLLVSAELQTLNESFEIPMVAGRLEDAQTRGMVLAKNTAEDYGVEIGDEVGIPSLAGVQQIPVVAIHDSQILNSQIVSPQAAEKYQLDTIGRLRIMITAAPGKDVTELRDQLRELMPPGETIAVMDKDDLVTFSAQMISRVLGVVYALVGLSIVVAALGIVNTLGLSISERTQEIALVRVVGMGKLRLAASIAVESILTALYGALVGVALGVGISTALVHYLREDGISQLSIPVPALLVTLVVTVIGAVVASWLPGWQAGRVPVLQAVKED